VTGETENPELDALLSERIGNFDQLQLLLLLIGAPGHYLEQEALVQAAQMPPDTAAKALAALAHAKLVEAVDSRGWRYAPADETVAAAAQQLAAAYRNNPVPIIRLLTARSIERVRTAALRTFADAFVLGKKDNG